MTLQQADNSMAATLRRIREEAGFTRTDLAEKVGIPAERIWAFEDCNLSSQRLLNFYGIMARRKKNDDAGQL